MKLVKVNFCYTLVNQDDTIFKIGSTIIPMEDEIANKVICNTKCGVAYDQIDKILQITALLLGGHYIKTETRYCAAIFD